MKNSRFVISASRRTDIPAFFADWFLQRLEDGYCEVANPFNPRQVSRISLLPEDVIAFIFWTRNPKPFAGAISQLIELSYKFGFMITVTGYPQWLEPDCPSVENAVSAFKELARQIGKESILWRYDPIIISQTLDFAWHINNFARLSRLLSPYTSRCIISFADFYRKTQKHLATIKAENFNYEPLRTKGALDFLLQIKRIAVANSLELTTCCETDKLLMQADIISAGCISNDWLRKICGLEMPIPSHKGQRKNCQCIYSKDIGTYNTCRHGCKYCYATRNHAIKVSK